MGLSAREAVSSAGYKGSKWKTKEKLRLEDIKVEFVPVESTDVTGGTGSIVQCTIFLVRVNIHVHKLLEMVLAQLVARDQIPVATVTQIE